MKKTTIFRAPIVFLISAVLSKIIVSIIYLGYRVIDANNKGLLPLDSEKLYESWQLVLNNPVYAYIPVGIICLLFFLFKKNTVTNPFPSKSISWFTGFKTIIFSISFGYFLRSSLSYIADFLLNQGWVNKDYFISSTVAISMNSVEYILQIAVMVILVPVYEELLFRKMFLSDLLTKYSEKISNAIVISVFTGLHGGTNLPYALAVGIITVCAYRNYGNILLPILIHSSFNFIGTVNLDFIQRIAYFEPIIYGFSIGSSLYYIVDYTLQSKRKRGK